MPFGARQHDATIMSNIDENLQDEFFGEKNKHTNFF